MNRFLSRLYIPATAPAAPKARPSVAFLVMLNGLVFFALGAIGTPLLGIVFFVPIFLVYLVFSALLQVLVRKVVERRHVLRPLPRVAAYLSPLPLMLLVGLILPRAPGLPNKQNPAISADGRYEARFRSPAPGWEVGIVDHQTKASWKTETPFLPHLQIYWRWDGDNRLWIYNSDDGGVHLLDFADQAWRMREWGHAHVRAPQTPTELIPPPELYPPYAAANP